MRLNDLPDKDWISQKYSPRKMVTKWNLEFKKQQKVVLGSYMEAHDNPNIINKIPPNTDDYITIGPTGNLQGTQKMFCLKPGRVLKRMKTNPMIASDQITKKMNEWCKKSKRYQYGKT